MKPLRSLVLMALASIPSYSFAECTLTRESCTYECIETNQHGQCVKTKKNCTMECIEYKVDVTGQDTKNYPPPELEREKEKK